MGNFQSHSWRSLQSQTARPGTVLAASRVLLISSVGLKDLCKQGQHFSSQHHTTGLIPPAPSDSGCRDRAKHTTHPAVPMAVPSTPAMLCCPW